MSETKEENNILPAGTLVTINFRNSTMRSIFKTRSKKRKKDVQHFLGLITWADKDKLFNCYKVYVLRPTSWKSKNIQDTYFFSQDEVVEVSLN